MGDLRCLPSALRRAASGNHAAENKTEREQKMKANRMTAEEQKAHDAAVAARREQKRIEAEEARAKRVAEENSMREKLVLMAATWANAKPLTADKPAERVAYVMNRVGSRWQDCDAQVQEFARKLKLSPFYEFTWATDPMKAACQCEIMARIMRGVEQGTALVEVLSCLRGEMVEALLNNYDAPTSTSAAHNAVMLCQMEVRSGNVGHWEGVAAWEKFLKAE